MTCCFIPCAIDQDPHFGSRGTWRTRSRRKVTRCGQAAFNPFQVLSSARQNQPASIGSKPHAKLPQLGSRVDGVNLHAIVQMQLRDGVASMA